MIHRKCCIRGEVPRYDRPGTTFRDVCDGSLALDEGLEPAVADNRWCAIAKNRRRTAIMAFPFEIAADETDHAGAPRRSEMFQIAAPERAIGHTDLPDIIRSNDKPLRLRPQIGCKLTIRNLQPDNRFGCIHLQRVVARIRAQAQKIAITGPLGGLDKMITGVILKTKGVQYILRVAAAKTKCGSMVLSPNIHRRINATPEWEKMNILNATDIVTLININARFQRAAIDPCDLMPTRAGQIDPLIRIGQGDIHH